MIISNIDGVHIKQIIHDDSIADIWCIHGFGENGNSFLSMLESPLAGKYNIFIPDLPGFGNSAFQEKSSTLPGAADLLVQLINRVSAGRKIILIAHSMGAIIGMLAQKVLTDNIVLFINIEGFLIENKERYSSHINEYKNPDEFKEYILNAVTMASSGNVGMLGYIESLKKADSNALGGWATSCYEIAKGTKMAELYASMPCQKVYLSGVVSLKSDAKSFLEEHHLEHHQFPGGHWVMVENPLETFQLVDKCTAECVLELPRPGF